MPSKSAIRKVKKEIGVRKGEKLVVVTAGGGGDGFTLMDTYLSMLESGPRPIPFRSFLITGPFMPRQRRREIFARARRHSAISVRFYGRMEEIQAAADLVVCMGGYNTICEILSQGTVPLVIPREIPRTEQLIRARVFHRQNLLDYIPMESLNKENLREKIFNMLEHPEPFQLAISEFRLTGLDTMRERLDACRNHLS